MGDQELDQLGDNIFDAIHLIALRNNGLTNRRMPSRKCEADKRVADKVLKRKNNTPQQRGQQQGQKAQPQRQKRFKPVSNATWQGGIIIHRTIRLSASGAGLSVSRLPRLPACASTACLWSVAWAAAKAATAPSAVQAEGAKTKCSGRAPGVKPGFSEEGTPILGQVSPQIPNTADNFTAGNIARFVNEW